MSTGEPLSWAAPYLLDNLSSFYFDCGVYGTTAAVLAYVTDASLSEVMQDNISDASRRLAASLILMRSQRRIDGANYREHVPHMSASLAMGGASYVEVSRRRQM